MILLGSNDVYMNAGGGKNRTDPLGLHGGIGVAGDIAVIADILKNGYTDEAGQVAAGNQQIEILIGAIPPVDERRRWDSTDAGSSGFLWYESERGEDVDDDPNTDLTTNQVIDLINAQLAALAASSDYITFVDTMAPTYLIDENGTAVPVKPDGSGNPQGFDVPDDPADMSFVSDDLLDGVHLNLVGDQIVAGNFWDSGLRAWVSAAATATAVPEPSSFLLVGLLGGLVVAGRYSRRRRKLNASTGRPWRNGGHRLRVAVADLYSRREALCLSPCRVR